MRVPRILVVLAAAVALGACGNARDITSSPSADCGPLPTGATCAPASTLTYATFGRTFFADYCTRCHASTVVEPDRHGATPGVNFDSIGGIRDHLCTIDAFAGSGPNGTNTVMPFDITSTDPAQQFPTAGERAQLSEWLACGAPE